MTAVAFPNRFKNGVRKTTKLYMRSDGITENTKTITVVFQFAKTEHYSTTFQRHFSEEIFTKTNSIPLPRNDINFQLQITSRPHKRTTDGIFLDKLIAKNQITLHNLPNSSLGQS